MSLPGRPMSWREFGISGATIERVLSIMEYGTSEQIQEKQQLSDMPKLVTRLCRDITMCSIPKLLTLRLMFLFPIQSP